MINQAIQRYFFALWPENKRQKQFAKTAQQVLSHSKGKLIATRNLHITLAFLGELTDHHLQLAISTANEVNSEGFILTLDRLGYWKRPRVIWLAPSTAPDSLTELATQLQTLLSKQQLMVDQRSFKPHMTLMRKAYAKPKPIRFDPLQWPVDHFCLVRSTLNKAGAHYEIIQQWSLQ